MTELRVTHTADLPREDLQAVRTLLDGAFPADEAYTEQDHEQRWAACTPCSGKARS